MSNSALADLVFAELALPTIELPMIGLPLGGKNIEPSGDSFVLDLSALDGGDVLN